MKRREWIVGLVALAALAGLFAYEQHIHPFHWSTFAAEFARARWNKVLIGVGCIYLAFVFRAVRWAWFLRPNKRVPLFSLLGAQVMGFTAVALIGRIADLVRPYLVSRRTGLTVGSQMAVYVVERLFDGGSMAILFCSAILLSPAGSLPHQETFNRFGKGGLALAIAGALFLFTLRMAGEKVIRFTEKTISPLSEKLARGVGHKLRTFHAGLDTLNSTADFAVTISLSLSMWMLITFAYVEGTQAFIPAGVGNSHMWARCLALMAGGGVASVLQLPVIGWFTQIAALQVMLGPLFNMTPETAMACATTLLAITFLSVAPLGLAWAQFEHVNLRKVTAESEHAEEALEAGDGLDANAAS